MRQEKTKILFAMITTAVFVVLLTASRSYAQELRRVNFEDGTGSIGLAPGWQLDGAYRGRVQCVGPDGSAIILGTPWTILSPMSSIAGLPAAGQTPMARPGDIPGALREVLQKKVGATLTSLRYSPAPPAFPNVPAYYLLYQFQQNGRSLTAMGYFTTIYYGGGNPSWQLYSSAVVAPTDEFPQRLHTMLLMWRSWRSNGQEPRDGSGSAMFDKMLQDKEFRLDRMSEEFRKVL